MGIPSRTFRHASRHKCSGRTKTGKDIPATFQPFFSISKTLMTPIRKEGLTENSGRRLLCSEVISATPQISAFRRVFLFAIRNALRRALSAH